MPQPRVVYTDADFENLSWHDCHIWRLDFHASETDGTSDFVIGIDFIVDGAIGPDQHITFKVAPATLVFHGVTDPKVSIAWSDTGFQASIFEPSIDAIVREPIADQKVFLDRPYHRWRIALNWPKGGEITFGAVGLTQTLLAEPVPCDQQHLSLGERRRLVAR